MPKRQKLWQEFYWIKGKNNVILLNGAIVKLLSRRFTVKPNFRGKRKNASQTFSVQLTFIVYCMTYSKACTIFTTDLNPTSYSIIPNSRIFSSLNSESVCFEATCLMKA